MKEEELSRNKALSPGGDWGGGVDIDIDLNKFSTLAVEPILIN